MNPAVFDSGAPAVKPLALACAIAVSTLISAACAPAAAQEAPSTIVVTGARFPSADGLQPIGATVISQDDIRRAGVNDVNSAIRKIGGVFGRQSLDSSPDFALDLRGFGTNSAQNLVIMVDGVRLNENELANSVLSTIPIDTVERIEITRGGSSVLYGEGATGGVIQVFTRRARDEGMHGSVFAEAGCFRQHDVRVALSQVTGDISADLAVARQGSDNYRENADFDQRNFSLGLQTRYIGGRAGIRVESAQQQSRFPGSLSLEQFEANPRQSLTQKDFGSLNTTRTSAFAEYRLGAVDLAAELSHRERNVRSNYLSGDFSSVGAYDGRQDQFSPRARWLGEAGGMLNEAVAGVDLTRWVRKTTSDYSRADARQKSKALYLRDELRFDSAHDARLALGARRELFDKDTSDALAGSLPESRAQAQNAWDAQLSVKPMPLLTVYGKAGQSYRVANVDENGYRASADILKPQTSHDLELGASFGDAVRKVTARVFRHKLRDEIFFDPTLAPFGFNTNLDPTRRQGVEIDADSVVTGAWHASAHVQHVNASFTDGPDAGRELVLVPKNVVTARLAWQPGNGQSADVGAQWVDRQRYGSDFSNTCDARMPSYVTFDGRYAVKAGPWEIALSGLNLADRRYFSNAFGCRYGIYPSDGRQLKLSARYDF
ncbi:TonB-dependent receptor [Massilia forsythiae]|uniref:TonB-dependent receptor n=1 Tax=Massilia forsythiae TaxID=2728020 RepID=A0A7Z2VTD1_9BURK|nr:TonB-dependent receptor [Massilia forsythiae]QJD98818.1 TonB-dependent receptor [Massilia forsythiae]